MPAEVSEALADLCIRQVVGKGRSEAHDKVESVAEPEGSHVSKGIDSRIVLQARGADEFRVDIYSNRVKTAASQQPAQGTGRTAHIENSWPNAVGEATDEVGSIRGLRKDSIPELGILGEQRHDNASTAGKALAIDQLPKRLPKTEIGMVNRECCARRSLEAASMAKR